MKREKKKASGAIVVLLALLAIVLIAGIMLNIYTMGLPAEKPTGASGEVKLYIAGGPESSSTSGMVSLVVAAR